MSIEAMKLALEGAANYIDKLGGDSRKYRQAIEQAQKQEPVAKGKLKVTLQDTPTEIELAQYKRMFEAACSALGAIGEALGIDEDEGGAEPILAAIEELKASPPQRQPLTDEQRMELWRTTKFRGNGGQIDWFIEGTRAAEAAHGIKGEA